MAALFARPLLRSSQQQCRRNISLTAVAGDSLPPGNESSRERDRWRWWHDQKSSQLVSSLRDPRTPPSRIWSYYNDFFSHSLPRDLALEIHQQVLRRCVAPVQAVRQGAAARLRERYGRDARHIYETRLQAVIRTIREAGMEPELEDYNFILEQFAAAGYQTGAFKVFKEIEHAGHEPNARTYALVLQAVAHRIELPCAYSLRKQMVEEASRISDAILADMGERGFAARSIHVDLCLRILRTTGNQDSFLNLLRQAYGIDLENPDCLPLSASDNSLRSLVAREPAPSPELLPFSVHVLNTVINFLGSHDRVSQMIVAYEVLTNPLPTRPPTTAQFDEDDDVNAFYDLSGPPAPSSRALPSAAPNTTTFIFLIKHLTRLRKFDLVRHYLLDAIRMERDLDNRLRTELTTKSLAEVATPKVAVRKSSLEPALGMGNRARRLAFLRWLWTQTKWLLASKRARLDFFYALQRQAVATEALDDSVTDLLAESELELSEEASTTNVVQEPVSVRAAEQPELVEELAPWRPPSALNDALPFFSRAPPPAAIDLDLDAPSPSLPPPTQSTFDVNVHIALLQKDSREIQDLLMRMRRAVWRLTTRRKEWLGRRVWAGKNIYLASEGRTVISRERWLEIANFKEPWKVGKKASLVRLPSRTEARPFKLPSAHPHQGVDPKFLGEEAFQHRPHVRWR